MALGQLIPTAALARYLPLLSWFGLSRSTVLTIEREIAIILDYAVATVTLTRRTASSYNDTTAALLVTWHACLWPLWCHCIICSKSLAKAIFR